LLQILTLLGSGGKWNADRLAAECGTSRRNVFRDLQMLSAAGVPYYYEKETGSYRLGRDFFMPPVELTLDEALALVCLGEKVGGGEQIPLLRSAARAVAKVRSQLPLSIRDRLEEVEPHLELRLAASISGDSIADVYERVRQAIATRRALRCTYEAPPRPEQIDKWMGAPLAGPRSGQAGPEDGTASFLFRPYSLFFSQRAWYVIGHHSGRRALRCLKLNRFSSVIPTDVGYEIPKSFSLKSYLGNAWRMIPGKTTYAVELHFDAAFAENIADTHWHDTQEIEWLEDRSILFRCKVSGLDEIVWWVLSMGPHCIVRRPPELARRVHALARAIASHYEPAAAPATGARPHGRRDRKIPQQG